jgi:hypothetical protein
VEKNGADEMLDNEQQLEKLLNSNEFKEKEDEPELKAPDTDDQPYANKEDDETIMNKILAETEEDNNKSAVRPNMQLQNNGKPEAGKTPLIWSPRGNIGSDNSTYPMQS